MRYFTLLSICGMFFFSGCDERGLNPNDVSEPGFGGTIAYVSKLPSNDSLHDIRIVAVPYFPVDTTFGLIFTKIVEAIIPFSESLSATADSGKTIQYQMFVKPQTYYYVAVVQQYGMNPFVDWRVISVYGYTSANPNPKIVTVEEGEFTISINFIVDFYNLPPQPFTTP